MKKRKKALVGIIFVLVLLLVLVAFLVTKCSRDDKDIDEAKTDITVTLDSLLGKDDGKIYMKGVSSLYFDSNTIFQNDGAGAVVSREVQYEIERIELNGDAGKVRIHITAPDIVKIFREIIDGKNIESETELLEAFTNVLLTEYPIIEKDVECSLELVERRWLVVPNEDLYNSLSGGLYSYMTDRALSTVDDLYGGESNE